MPATMSDHEFVTGAIAEIRATIGTLAMLHAGDSISAADMRAAVTAISANCDVLDVIMATPPAGDIIALPIRTLDDVVRRNSMRSAVQRGNSRPTPQGTRP